jgi:hypothetical protein
LLQCLGKVAVAGLQLLEEAHVLDRDDRLIGEGLEQGNLPLGEELGLRAPQSDCSHCGD